MGEIYCVFAGRYVLFFQACNYTFCHLQFVHTYLHTIKQTSLFRGVYIHRYYILPEKEKLTYRMSNHTLRRNISISHSMMGSLCKSI